MSPSKTPIRIFVADRDERRQHLLTSTVDEVRKAGSPLVDTTPEGLPDAVPRVVQGREGVLTLVSVDDAGDIEFLERAKDASPSARVFSLALIPFPEDEIVREAYGRGVNACLELPSDERTLAENVRVATRFALETIQL